MVIGGATTVKDSIVKHMFEKVVIKNNFKLTYRGTEKEESVPLSHSCSMGRGEVPAWVSCHLVCSDACLPAG